MRIIPLLALLPLAACTQRQMARSASDVLGSVILSGRSRGTTTTTTTTTSSTTPAATKVLGTAEQYLGTPYKWGGSTPSEGFDCSGYVKYVYGRQGVRLPRTSREQAAAGASVTARVSALRAGDLMLFAESKKAISHVAIYAGAGRIIHSTSSGGGVRYDDLNTSRGKWFANHMVAARRLAADGRSLVQALELLERPNMPFDPPDLAPPPR